MKCDGCPPKFRAEFPPCFQKYKSVYTHCNPGNIKELHYLAHRLKPTLLDGIELDYVHRLSPNKSINANWILSHNKPSGFRFGGIFTALKHDDFMVSAKYSTAVLNNNYTSFHFKSKLLPYVLTLIPPLFPRILAYSIILFVVCGLKQKCRGQVTKLLYVCKPA